MKFSERLKNLRESKNMTQEGLSKKSGISCRSIQNYEAGTHRPRYGATEKLAEALEIPIYELLGEKEALIAQANDKYGSKGAKQAEQLMEEVTGLFAGGDMAEEDMDIMMKAIQDAYWIAKEKNKKYTRKDYLNKG